MDKWVLIVTIILTVALVIVIVLTILYQKQNGDGNRRNILYPFSATIKPGQNTVLVTNSLGKSQIDCSAVGGKVNIVGAWVEVTDPNSQCTGSSPDILNVSCGLKGKKGVPCKQDGDCGAGMTCAGGLCAPSQCPLTPNGKGTFDSAKCSCGGNYCLIQPGSPCDPNDPNVCSDPNGTIMRCVPSPNGSVCQVNPGQTCMAPDPFHGKFCAMYPLCSNVDRSNKTNVVNSTCSPSGSCRPRDASAYLAGMCDGQVSCNVLFDPSNPKSGLGPAPCDKVNISTLPISSGGGSYNQGYVVHGIYSCVVPE